MSPGGETLGESRVYAYTARTFLPSVVCRCKQEYIRTNGPMRRDRPSKGYRGRGFMCKKQPMIQSRRMLGAAADRSPHVLEIISPMGGVIASGTIVDKTNDSGVRLPRGQRETSGLRRAQRLSMRRRPIPRGLCHCGWRQLCRSGAVAAPGRKEMNILDFIEKRLERPQYTKHNGTRLADCSSDGEHSGCAAQSTGAACDAIALILQL